MMIDCCKKCLKIFCEKRNEIEECSNCISEVYWYFQKIDKKLGDKK